MTKVFFQNSLTILKFSGWNCFNVNIEVLKYFSDFCTNSVPDKETDTLISNGQNLMLGSNFNLLVKYNQK